MYIENINSPADVKKLNIMQLNAPHKDMHLFFQWAFCEDSTGVIHQIRLIFQLQPDRFLISNPIVFAFSIR